MKKRVQLDSGQVGESAAVPMITFWERSFLYLIEGAFSCLLVWFIAASLLVGCFLDPEIFYKVFLMLLAPIVWSVHLLVKYSGYE